MQTEQSRIPTILGMRHEDESLRVTLDYSGPDTYGLMQSARTTVEGSPELLQLYAKSLKDDQAAAKWSTDGPAGVFYGALTEWLDAKIAEGAPWFYSPMRQALWDHQERARQAVERTHLFG